MAENDDRPNLIVAAKPIIALIMAVAWPMAMYLRNQAFADPGMEAGVAMLTNPIPLGITTLVFLVLALLTPWPNRRQTIAGLASAIAGTMGVLMVLVFAPEGLFAVFLLVLVIGLSRGVYSLILRRWPSRECSSR